MMLKRGLRMFLLSRRHVVTLKAYSSIDEHPEEFSRDGLQKLAIVQLAEHDLLLQNMVLQDHFQEALVHGHHLVCEKQNKLCQS